MAAKIHGSTFRLQPSFSRRLTPIKPGRWRRNVLLAPCYEGSIVPVTDPQSEGSGDPTHR
jgi:hypothetical protein